jgi:hypothetical protein
LNCELPRELNRAVMPPSRPIKLENCGLARGVCDKRLGDRLSERVLRRFGQSADPGLRWLVSHAYDSKHCVLEQLGDDGAAARVRTEQRAWSNAFAGGASEDAGMRLGGTQPLV